MILVIGATGKVGRHVVSGLLARGAAVGALVRRPEAANLPEDAALLRGDLRDPAGIGARRVVYLSAEAAARRPDSTWAAVERAIAASATEWTCLRPTGFAANTLMWADQIRRSGVVQWPYGRARRSLVHERDIADVAVHTLVGDRHLGAHLVLTGPEALTQVEQAAAIGDAIGRPVAWQELPRAEAEVRLAGAVPDTALETWAGFVDAPEVVTSTVNEVTGHPARSFAEWARDHADAFR